MYTVAVDAMGGDFAPESPVRGSLRALREFEDISILLVGRKEAVAPLLGAENPRARVIDARDVITNHEPPVLAIRRKTDSSLVVALRLVKDGDAQALVSAGSTGAVMAGSLFRLNRIPGVERPAIAITVPTLGKPTLLLDAGANVDCAPETLVQFAAMGSAYAKSALGYPSPRVALVNIGEEAEKGNALTKAAHKLLSAPGRPFAFSGNIEARGIPLGEADVAVCDGFTGNILMKSMEGLSKAIFTMLKRELTSSLRGKIGGLLAADSFRRMKHAMNPDEVGGALMLGASQVVIKAHGNSSEFAFFSAIRQARAALEANVIRKIADTI
ncbi:MAG: phosphate acyltransferase PlsX [Oscillospiraceae bacterium]|jgi:glycerol-3-phosphate acyltransferase PlsX|nr:phosphate acyltransferase PlsX [Oscillospiraceae bacterium]